MPASMKSTTNWPFRRVAKYLIIAFLVVVAIWSLSFAVMGTGSENKGFTAGAATRCNPIHNPRNVKPGLSDRKYRDTIRCGSRAVKRQLVKLFRVGSYTRVKSGRIAAGCRGSITRTVFTYIYGSSVRTSWKRVTQNGWCWRAASSLRAGRITSAGAGIFDQWTGSGFCFSAQSHGNAWWSPYWERKIWNTGTVQSCFFPIPQASISAKIYYRADGTVNTG